MLNVLLFHRGVYFSVWPSLRGEGQKCGKIKCFSPIDLKCTKLKKRLTNFRLRRAAHHYNKFNLGQKYKSRGGGIWIYYTPLLFQEMDAVQLQPYERNYCAEYHIAVSGPTSLLNYSVLKCIKTKGVYCKFKTVSAWSDQTMASGTDLRLYYINVGTLLLKRMHTSISRSNPPPAKKNKKHCLVTIDVDDPFFGS